MIIVLKNYEIALRLSLHNITYNWSRKPKLPWYYVGTTSKSDDIEKDLSWSKNSILISRIISFLFAILTFWLAIK